MIRSYRKKRSLAPAVVAAALLIFLSYSAFYDLLGLRQVVQTGLYPFQYVTVAAWRGMLGVPESIIKMRDLAGENVRLEKENKELAARQSVLDELGRENDRLRKALGFRQANRFGQSLLPVQVIGKSPAPWFTVLEVGAGSRQGIRVGLPVIARGGLVGRIVEVAPLTAKVMLLTDPDSSIAAVISPGRDFGVVVGDGSGSLAMKFVSSGASVAEGDLVATSSLSTIFPSAVPIGTVSRVVRREHDLFYMIKIKPAVDLSKLEEAYIVR